jgi:hypothetical protein
VLLGTDSAEQSEIHKQDLLRKQKEGKGHWKPELASDSEEAVSYLPLPLDVSLLVEFMLIDWSGIIGSGRATCIRWPQNRNAGGAPEEDCTACREETQVRIPN